MNAKPMNAKTMNDSVRSSIRAFMSRSFQGHEPGDDDDIFAQGFGNSLFALQLVAFIEREYGIEVDPDDLDLDNFRSINAVAALVERKREG